RADHEFESVLLARVVRARYHDAAIESVSLHGKMQLRCRTQSDAVHQQAPRDESFHECALEIRRGEAPVPADGDTPQPARAHPGGIGKAELACVAEIELSPDDTAKIVGADRLGIDARCC